MGKRQIRIFARDVSHQMPAIIGQEVNILLKNSTVFHGIIKLGSRSDILLTDMLGRKHTIVAESIAEIILDKSTPY